MAAGTIGTAEAVANTTAPSLNGSSSVSWKPHLPLREDPKHAAGCEYPPHGSGRAGERAGRGIERNGTPEEVDHLVAEAAGQVGLLRPEPGDAGRQRGDGDHQQRVPAAVVVQDKAIRRVRQTSCIHRSHLVEQPHEKPHGPPQGPIATVDDQRPRIGCSRGRRRLARGGHAGEAAGSAGAEAVRVGSVTRRRAHAPISSSIAISTKMPR